MPASFRTYPNGARRVLDPARYLQRTGRTLHDLCTCGTCGRVWDDSHGSAVTPAPSARCPFEYSHHRKPRGGQA